MRPIEFLKSSHFALVVFALAPLGMLYSRAMLSIFIIGMLILPFIQLGPKAWLNEWKCNVLVQSFSLIVLTYALSYFFSEDTHFWFNRFKSNLAWFCIPLGLLGQRSFGPKFYVNCFKIFLTVIALSAIILIVDFALNSSLYLTYYTQGRTIPTPIIHTRYSFILSLTSLFGLLLWHKQAQYDWNWIWKTLTLIVLLFLHVLAVRNGLLSFYGGIFIYLLFQAIKSKQWKALISFTATSVVVLFLATQLIPTMGKKLDYMIWDIKNYLEPIDNGIYSDNIRILSFKFGAKCVEEHPIFGIGIGDIENEAVKWYETYAPNLPREFMFPPVNQYLYWLAAFGIVGFLLCMTGLFYPLWHHRLNSFVLLLFAALMLNMLVENTVEFQIGKSLFLIFICLGIGFRLESTTRA